MGIVPTLYVNDSIEALDFYTKAFDLTLGNHVKSDDGSFFHAALMRGDNEIFAISDEHDSAIDVSCKLESLSFYQHVAQLGINLGSEDAVKKAFTILSERGRVEFLPQKCEWSACHASVIDKNNRPVY